MIRGVLTLSTLVSVVLFPWLFTAVLAIVSAFWEPLVPLGAGIFADALYYTPHVQAFPLFTLAGAACTATAFFVRSRLRASIMRG